MTTGVLTRSGSVTWILLLLVLAGASEADPILVRTTGGTFGYGGVGWQTMTGQMDAATGGNVQVVADLSDLNAMLRFPTVWVDLSFDAVLGGGPERTGRLTAGELANLQSYAATGRRLVLFGENSANWEAWNADILGTVGGQNVPAVLHGISTPILDHFLTGGIEEIVNIGDGIAEGGQPLFDTGFATLWGAQGNALTVLSVDVVNDFQSSQFPHNRRFGQNIVDWAAGRDQAAPVPEPATMLLLGTGLAGLGMRRWRVSRQH